MQSKNWIGGEWITPNGEQLVVKNPSKLIEEVGVLTLSDSSQVFAAEEAARKALAPWSALTSAARGECLCRMAAVLEQNADELAALASMEMGKPISEMRGEVTRGVHLLRYYAAEGVRANGSVIPSTEKNVLQYSKRVPLGVVAVITPWNFPVAIPIWKFAPALICGNTVIWKPSEIASLTATRLAEIFESAQLPPGVLNLVIGTGREIGSKLLQEAAVDAVSFTGSSAAGNSVAVACAKRNIKFQTEMGGKNAAVVLNDADLEKIVPILLSGAFRSAGQKCTATSRIIVERGIYAALADRLQQAVAALKVGPALDPSVYLGPVSSQAQYDKVKSYVEMAHQEATLVAETAVNEHTEAGYFISPLVVSGVDAKHALVQEEIFGPVAVL
ncbi:aldehyde dehydrogenase family protein, partial [Microbacteriaceae bacterium K1510]|nr:aldehyde dehydrogenase family protein [Microbacteriaceae bacterium K1510]